MADAIIPLFPLEVVLYPGQWLPLHIFEPRYKEMIGWCLDRREAFGIILEQEGKLSHAGCTAEILEVMKKYPDGRMDISTQGAQRFEVQKAVHDRAYLCASVVFFDDDDSSPPPKSLVSQAKALFERMLEKSPRGWPPAKDSSPSGSALSRAGLPAKDSSPPASALSRAGLPAKRPAPTRVSFQIAAALSFDLSLKQKLLEMRDERARLQLLVSSMSRWLPLIERARKSAGGNGRYH